MIDDLRRASGATRWIVGGGEARLAVIDSRGSHVLLTDPPLLFFSPFHMDAAPPSRRGPHGGAGQRPR